MKKSIYHRLQLGLAAILMPCLLSCGLIEMEFDNETQQLVSFEFTYDTVYAMKGDTFFLAPYLYPDNGLSSSLYWQSDNRSIVNCINDTIVAESEGWTRVMATTLSNGITDTCTVCIMRPWLTLSHPYPDDMAVYAHITVDGKEPGKHMMFCAYLPDEEGVYEPRALGVPMNEERSIYFFRVWGELGAVPDNDDDSGLEPVLFRAYNKNTLQVKVFPQQVGFNGQTKGTPSHPIELAL